MSGTTLFGSPAILGMRLLIGDRESRLFVALIVLKPGQTQFAHDAGLAQSGSEMGIERGPASIARPHMQSPARDLRYQAGGQDTGTRQGQGKQKICANVRGGGQTLKKKEKKKKKELDQTGLDWAGQGGGQRSVAQSAQLV
ncbi:hypothetical protein BU24DRAFT_403672 [Aaosphaeria arxii CBS 175.79]|uniref:Uncharacterized protein n=1 Tax=Aaosphaeria arxii CBS 175.79 TaxID=1450172 RepID=A0A6A5Y7P9_9PLEO|nr:uncharacterized protein BU24DRAFT_403672 [Aaosphaeria arxii CBS 175.79]KAF2020574.1 hypothetical protein BU24DRAFT_403672 [Aaosphaeria arxii CBS 175.79]